MAETADKINPKDSMKPPDQKNVVEKTTSPMKVVSAAPPIRLELPVGLPTAVANMNGPAKVLPSIQPKGITQTVRQINIMPKNGQQLAAQTGNFIIAQQPVQQVLINGQLFPVVQTTNGTHIIIQQPMALAPGTKVVTANSPQIQPAIGIQTAMGVQPAVGVQQTIVGQSAVGVQSAISATPTGSQTTNASDTVTSTTALPTSQVNGQVHNNTTTVTSSAQSTSSATSLISNLPLQAPTHSQQASHVLQTVAQRSIAQQLPANRSTPMLDQTTVPVSVSPHTQQILTKLQNQINSLRAVQNPDENTKNTMQQLENVKQQIFTELKNQVQLHTLQQQQAVKQQTVGVAAGDVKMTAANANLSQLIATFSNVKVGDQVYNIQLSEVQKQAMLEQLRKLPPNQQQNYLAQQQLQILNNALKTTQLPPPPPQKPLTNNKISTSSRPSSRSASRANSKPSTPAPSSSQNSIPTTVLDHEKCNTPTSDKIESPSPKSSKQKRRRRAKRSIEKPMISTTERIKTQLLKDQEMAVKTNYKKPFTSKMDACQRLIRFHVFHTPLPQHIEDDEIFETFVNKVLLKKDAIEDKIRKILWKDSLNPTKIGEPKLIAELLLEDEKDQLDNDKKMFKEDLDMFKLLYADDEPLVNADDESNSGIDMKFSTKSSSPIKKSSRLSPVKRKRGRPPKKKLPSPETVIVRTPSPAQSFSLFEPDIDNPTIVLQRDLRLAKLAALGEDKFQSTEHDINEPASITLESETSSPEAANTESSSLSEKETLDIQTQDDSEEDEYIDIGEPPTPPLISEHNDDYSNMYNMSMATDSEFHEENSSPTQYHPNMTFVYDTSTSSPKKSSCAIITSETVCEQSEQVDISHENQSDSEQSSRDEESSESGAESSEESETEREAEQPMIQPIRINKRHLEQYDRQWQEATTNPPPIKIRLRMDRGANSWGSSHVQETADDEYYDRETNSSEASGDDEESDASGELSCPDGRSSNTDFDQSIPFEQYNMRSEQGHDMYNRNLQLDYDQPADQSYYEASEEPSDQPDYFMEEGQGVKDYSEYSYDGSASDGPGSDSPENELDAALESIM